MKENGKEGLSKGKGTEWIEKSGKERNGKERKETEEKEKENLGACSA